MAHARRRNASWMSSRDLPTDAQSPEPMQQGKRLLDDPAVLAQPGAVFGAAPGDDRLTPTARTCLRYLSWS